MPSNTITTALEDVCTLVQYGYTTKAKDSRSGVGFIRGTDISRNSINWNSVPDCLEEPSQIEKYLVKSGDILITRMGTIGTSAVVEVIDRPSVFASYLIRHVIDREKADPLFIGYVLKSKLFSDFIHTHGGAGAVQPNINAKTLGKFSFPLPQLEYQQKAVSILKSLDNKIQLLRDTSLTLESIAQSLFKSWFIDFEPAYAKQLGTTPKGLDETTAELFPDIFQESEVGLVPNGWKFSSMDDISTVGIGKTPPRKESHWFSENPEDVCWVSIKDMGESGTFISSTSEYLTVDSIQRFNIRQVPNNTVILSFKMTIGRVAITDGNMTTNEAIAHFKLEEQSPLTTEFIYLYLKQFDYSRLSSTSSIADAVNSKTIKTIPILVPDARVVMAFQNVVSPIFERIKLSQQQAQTLTSLRETLLPRLISGQLHLSKIETLFEGLQ